MKFKPKIFARALYEATRDISEKEAARMIKKFVFLLGTKGLLSRTGKVIEEYEKYSREKGGRILAEVESARAFSPDEEKDVISMLEKMTGKKVEWQAKVLPALLGGLRVRFTDRVFDGTLRTQLDTLNKNFHHNA